MKRIRAFTLIELMVVMVMSAIVFTIAYYAYRTVSSFQVNQTAISMKIEQYRSLNRLMENDLMDCDIAIQQSERELKLMSKKRGDLSYLFGDNIVTRTTSDNLTDSFYVHFAQPNIASKYLIPDDKIVSEIELYLIFHDNPITFHFQKLYAAERLINKKIEYRRNDLH